MAKSFKFTKMSKKVPFLPALHSKGPLGEELTSVDKGAGYLDGFKKDALVYPQRAKDWSKKFAPVDTCGGDYFNRPAG